MRRVALLLMLSACIKSTDVRSPADVDAYRSQITRIQHAIDETRARLASTRSGPYLPELTMRLAELTAEEARFHHLVALERQEDRAESLHLPEVRMLKEQAIALYRTLVARYPDAPLAPQALFNISQEQRELGQMDSMRTTLEVLIETYPSSRYRAEADLSLGNYLFDQGEFEDAAGHYRSIVSAGPGPHLGVAHYKLGWVAYNDGDCPTAIQRFDAAITASRRDRANPIVEEEPTRSVIRPDFEVPDEVARSDQAYEALRVEREALVDLTFCYAQVHEPERATQYLRERAASRSDYVAALARMARRYMVVEQPIGASKVLRETLRLAQDEPERLDDARLLNAILTQTADYRDLGDDAELMLRVLERRLTRLDMGSEEATELRTEFGGLLRNLALKSDKALRGDGKGEATADQTARAYEVLLANFPEVEEPLELHLNLADLLVETDRPLLAGHAYRRAVDLLDAGAALPDSPADATLTETLYSATVAFQTAAEDESATMSDQVLGRAGLREAGLRYLEREGLGDKDKAGRVRFAIARSYYDEGRYPRAIDLLTAVAHELPGTAQADAAALLVLDANNAMNDLSGLIRSGQRFLQPDSPVSVAVRAKIEPIVATAEQRRLDELSLGASGDRAGDMERLVAFAERYKDSDLGERALLATFVAARADGDAERLYAVGDQLLERYPDSEQVAGVASTSGQVAAARFEYDRAVSILGRAANLTKDPAQKAALLLGLGEIHEQLANPTAADAAYRAARSAAKDDATKAEATTLRAALWERETSGTTRIAKLKELEQTPAVRSRLALVMLTDGDRFGAEDILYDLIGSADDPDVLARARYGVAESMLLLIEEFEPYPSLDAIDELVGSIEVAMQSYLEAARTGDATYGLAALARLARTSEVGAEQLLALPMPDDLPPDQVALVREAIQARADALEQSTQQVLDECARRARAGYRVDGAAQACLTGVPPKQDPVRFQRLRPRTPSAPSGLEEARKRVAVDSADADALREIGAAYAAAGDHHTARIAYGKLAALEPTAADLVAWGRAAQAIGDVDTAAHAYGRAVGLGDDAAATALSELARSQGLQPDVFTVPDAPAEEVSP